jgi:hypothetical protein
VYRVCVCRLSPVYSVCIKININLPPLVKEFVEDQLCVSLFDIGGSDTQKITYGVGIEGMEHLIRIMAV